MNRLFFPFCLVRGGSCLPLALFRGRDESEQNVLSERNSVRDSGPGEHVFSSNFTRPDRTMDSPLVISAARGLPARRHRWPSASRENPKPARGPRRWQRASALRDRAIREAVVVTWSRACGVRACSRRLQGTSTLAERGVDRGVACGGKSEKLASSVAFRKLFQGEMLVHVRTSAVWRSAAQPSRRGRATTRPAPPRETATR
ncbi:hypothetical protein SEVIR_2G296050v4 [Setaria viridis]|uniref:Secreted protein n=1 Tax=Setaria viridis TaxID=4556 RepID=A0A4U6VWC9_SETVI|nr:hypothetical protein SEVIR_2G296050v2 [Setaria viridis]